MSTKTVLFLGVRRGAIEAARKLGLRVLAISKQAIAPALKQHLQEFEIIDFAKDPGAAEDVCNRWFEFGRPDAIIPLTESGVTVAASLRERFSINGFRLDAARKFNDKLLMKQAIIAAGIPCASFRSIQTDTDMDELANHLGLPLVIKEINNSGGRGLTVIRTRDDLNDNRYAGHMAEAFVNGVEFSTESIVFQGQICFQNFTEYFIPGWANIVPAPIEQTIHDAAIDLNQRVIRALGIDNGMTHLELFSTKQGLLFGEIAVRPPGGYIMDLIAAAYNFCPWRAFIQTHLNQQPEIQNDANGFAGALILHPGIGHVKEVIGLDTARATPGVIKFKCNVKPGDFIGPRLGTGQNKGYAIVRGDDYAFVVDALKSLNREVKFVVG